MSAVRRDAYPGLPERAVRLSPSPAAVGRHICAMPLPSGMTLRLIPTAGHLAIIEMQETMLGLELANLTYPCSAWSLCATTSVSCHVAVGPVGVDADPLGRRLLLSE